MSKKVILQVPYAFIVNKVGGRLVLFCEQMIFFLFKAQNSALTGDLV